MKVMSNDGNYATQDSENINNNYLNKQIELKNEDNISKSL